MTDYEQKEGTVGFFWGLQALVQHGRRSCSTFEQGYRGVDSGQGDENMVAITYAQLPKSVKKGQRILVQEPFFEANIIIRISASMC